MGAGRGVGVRRRGAWRVAARVSRLVSRPRARARLVCWATAAARTAPSALTLPAPTATALPDGESSSDRLPASAMPDDVSVAASASSISTLSASGLKAEATGLPPSKMPSTSVDGISRCASLQ